MISRGDQIKAAAYPEMGAGAYTRCDGSVEFYSRVNALVSPDSRVLDFGAGRAAWFEDDTCEFRRRLRSLRGRVRQVIACDVDPAVASNRSADATVQIHVDRPLPFEDGSFDLIIADYVFEHIGEPETMARELTRILAPGGWLCARTPNGLGYVAIASRIVGSSRHVKALARIQPERKDIDVFPTEYKLNSISAIRRHFPMSAFKDCTYRFDPEPAYHFNNPFIFSMLRLLHWLLPPQCSSQLFVFLQKRPL